MLSEIRKIFTMIKEFFFGDFDRKTIVSSSGSFLVSIVFAVYNGYLGIYYQSLWHGSICIYYIIISVLRAALVISDIAISRADRKTNSSKRKTVFILTHVVLLVMNLSLIVPISLMVKMEKPVDMTLIPAIAMAAYTTYKIIIASINMARKRKTENILVKEQRTINFIDALLSIAVLQNTLIMVNSGGGKSAMFIVSAVTSAAILISVITASALDFVSGIRQSKRSDKYPE